MSVITKLLKALFVVLLTAFFGPETAAAYDPNDSKIAECCLPPEGMFEAFYPREVEGIPNSASRPAHGHGSFFKHRNPALVDTKNAAAYGYRFDGKRRFNFD
ncbi:uncharacterized protein LOC128255780 [Drosophila gunungcola]|uniref:Uncharacterized protein n=1 Tax=Drosophila gunungcola TaxID=103775 RepID=A0A9Q0BMM9_9MUSC|nr:uncharacterized protein LOC108149931 [Drosophila elegans]XP_052841484.1 uncharacterized protein LOC128255780 [Drosophila gunungcola]KAI8037190.1 hypothetical protein M5D96_009941 [Drosophila gunungcola]